MTRASKPIKRAILYLFVAGVLVFLFIREVRVWQTFGWRALLSQVQVIHFQWVLFGSLLFEIGFVLRAWRWKLLLTSLRPTTVVRLLGPTFVGFTAIALLGRPGEFVRPYLIARKEGLPLSSQVAAWAVERVFDLGAFGAIVLAGAFTIEPHSIPYLENIRNSGLLVLAIIVAVAALIFVLRRRASWLQVTPGSASSPEPRWHEKVVSQTLSAFDAGLNTVTDAQAFVKLAALSLFMWCLIALGYAAILHAFPFPLRAMPFGEVMVLMACSALGGLVPVPASATSQLLIVAILLNVFRTPVELSVSAGTILWLAGNMAPVPIGLVYLRYEHLSLLAVSRQSRAQSDNPAELQKENT